MDIEHEIEKARAAYNTLETQRRDLHAALKRVEELEGYARNEMQRLIKVKESANYTSPRGEWYLSFENGPSSYSNRAWSKFWRLETTLYSFGIMVTEVTNLKKYKFCVTVTGSHYTRGYMYNDYLKNKYGKHHYDSKSGRHIYEYPKGNELEMKFTTEKEAMRHMVAWQIRLYDEHEEEIELEKELIASVKKETESESA